jgi:thiopeptide-type bacteriocin biosynthesis protein
VLRTPLLSFDELAAWGGDVEAPGAVGDPRRLEASLARDRARLGDRLAEALGRPELREALFLASPRLDEAFEAWQRDPDGGEARRLEPVLVSYFSRAAARPTPFGLFAGCTTGTLGPRTGLRLVGRGRYRRRSRLDIDYLCALAEAVERDPRLRRGLVYEPNPALYEVAGRIRLAEERVAGDHRSYHLVAVEPTPYLTATLGRAEGGASLAALASALVDDDVARAEAEEYVGELAGAGLLMSDARPAITGPGPAGGLVATLGRAPATRPAAGRLRAAVSALEAIDAAGLGGAPERYRAVASLLDGLSARPDLSRLVQVDLVKPGRETRLGRAVVAEMTRAVEILHRLVPAGEDEALARFRQHFIDRYGSREVDLVEALDEEAGIGFDPSGSPAAEASPLLAGLPFPVVPGGDGERWSSRHDALLRTLADALARGATEIRLTREALDRLAPPERERLPLPDAFCVLAAVAGESGEAVERGAFRVYVDRVCGPSGALFLGRFCHADEDLHRFVLAHLREEEARRPEATFAEIVHLPDARSGNVLCRPVVRDHEIPYLGRSGVPADRRIPVADLVVSVRDDRVVLRSRRLDREVVPRLTSAHLPADRSLGIYRFLWHLQHQGVAADLAWDWGPLDRAPFLPRVVVGRAVLCRACWNLDDDDLRILTGSEGARRFAAVQAWREERRLPRWVALADDDRELVVDLDNVLCVDALAHHLRGRPRAVLVEMLPGPDELCATGPEGRFVHEIVVPFVQGGPGERDVSPGTAPVAAAAAATRRRPARRRFPPGSEWLYAKLYGGEASADRVITDAVGPVVEAALASGAADGWFFLRYADPDPHLRVRLHGPPGRLHAEVRPRLEAAAAASVDAGGLWRVQFDTYEREVERYGGDRGVEVAERVFAADSDAALAVLRSLAGEAGADLRWRVALCGIDRLFDDLGLTREEKRALAREGREAYENQFGVDGRFRRKVAERYRSERGRLEALLDAARRPHPERPGRPERPDDGGGGLLARALTALDERSRRVAPLAGELRRLAHRGLLAASIPDVAADLAHLHVNRLLRSAQPAQELVLYELLDRLYTSEAARPGDP